MAVNIAKDPSAGHELMHKVAMPNMKFKLYLYHDQRSSGKTFRAPNQSQAWCNLHVRKLASYKLQIANLFTSQSCFQKDASCVSLMKCLCSCISKILQLRLLPLQGLTYFCAIVKCPDSADGVCPVNNMPADLGEVFSGLRIPHLLQPTELELTPVAHNATFVKTMTSQRSN